MTREHRTLSFSSAAAAAQYDPSLLLALQAHRPRDERPVAPRRWHSLAPRVRRGLAGETGGALLLVAAIALALVWSNSPWRGSYSAFWHAPVALTVGPWTVGADLRTWVDEGLMTLFFLVVGLEAKRDATSASCATGAVWPCPSSRDWPGWAPPPPCTSR